MKEQKRINRRKFISAASVGAAAAVLPGSNYLTGMIFQSNNKLAVLGGERLRKKPFATWPQSSNKLEEMLVETAKSGKWCRLDGGSKTVNTFEKNFAGLIGTRFCLATGSGTQSLHTALYATGVEAGDEVLPCGEGGAIVGNDENLIDLCYAFHNIGLPRRDKVSSVKDSICGPKYRMNEWEGAVLLAHLDNVKEQVDLRNENAAYLSKRLDEIPGIAPQRLSKGVTKGTYYLYGFRYQKEYFNNVPKSKFLRALGAEGIPNTAMYFDRLNTQNFVEHTLNSKVFQIIYSKDRLNRYREQNQCPVNDKLSEQGVWLSQQMLLGTKEDMDDIVNAIMKIQRNKEELAKS